MIPRMPKVSSFTHFLTCDPSPFPSLFLLILIFTFHVPTCHFFSYFILPRPYYNCASHTKTLCNPIALSHPKRFPCGRWALRAAPIALLVVVSWLTEKDSAGVAAGNWGSRGGFPTISEHGIRECKAEAEEFGGCTPWILVGMILVLFSMAQRQALIRHCLFVRNM